MTELTGEDLLEGLFDPEDLNTVVFFHGLESGPHGTKYRALSEVYSVLSPDFQGLDFEERLSRAKVVTEGMKDIILVGSSFGGLLAAVLYSECPERISSYVLLAPALHLAQAARITSAPSDAIVIHGLKDEIVPIEASRNFCAKYDLKLMEVPDTHRLHGTLQTIIDSVSEVRDRHER